MNICLDVDYNTKFLYKNLAQANFSLRNEQETIRKRLTFSLSPQYIYLFFLPLPPPVLEGWPDPAA